MRSAKSYLAPHSSCFDEDPDTTCPRCGLEPEYFQHAILLRPACAQARDLLLKGVSDIGPDSHVWNDPPFRKALGQYITSTRTGFPPEMNFDFPSPLSTNFPPAPEEIVSFA